VKYAAMTRLSNMKPAWALLLPWLLMAAPPAVVAQFDYKTNGGTVTLTDYTGSGGAVTISNFVTSLGGYAFRDCSNLTSVTIPDSVINIGAGAFYLCTGLDHITIGGVLCIGNEAFYACSNLTAITIGPGLTNLGSATFEYCDKLASVYFQGNVPSVYLSGFNYDTTVYYLPGAASSNSFGPPVSVGFRPPFATALWTLPYPLILDSNPSLGVQSNTFVFIVSWTTNLPVVVEACVNLSNPVWQPLQTNTLTNSPAGGSFYFSDSQWTNYPARFYRVRSH
jgi:hypothetical protein